MAKKQSFADKASKKKHVAVCPACGNAINFTKIVKPTENGKGGYKMKAFTVGVVKCANKDHPDCVLKKANIMSEKEVQAIG